VSDLTPLITALRLPATNDGQAWTVADIAAVQRERQRYYDALSMLVARIAKAGSALTMEMREAQAALNILRDGYIGGER